MHGRQAERRKTLLHRLTLAMPVLCTLGMGVDARHPSITFPQRVEAQRAIERVYYSHQIGATAPFDEAVPTEISEQHVREYLRQSLALERFWRTPVTPQMLESELERIAAGTQMPERLAEIFNALGNDMFLIQETLARQALVGRLTREAFDGDPSIHGAARRRAEGLREELAGGGLSPFKRHPDRLVLDLIDVSARQGQPPPAVASPWPRLELDSAQFQQWKSLAPPRVGEPGPVSDEASAFAIRVLLSQGSGWARLAIYSIPRVGWSEWWAEAQQGLDPAAVVAVAGPLETPPSLSRLAGTGRPSAAPPVSCSADDSWIPLPTADAPEGGSAIWSGREMLVWDGSVGGRYAPVSDSWSPTDLSRSPGRRFGYTLVWTGNVMTVWGGLDGSGYLATGARYDPATDTWTPTSTLGAPQARYLHTAVWSGSRMIVWGGGYVDPDEPSLTGLSTGGLYDPIADTWSATPDAGAPAGSLGHTAVWTGHEMIVWGGHEEVAVYLNRGGRFDPAAGRWQPISHRGAPAARWLHQAVWTGREMIVWGGTNEGAIPPFVDGPLITGGRYDLRSDIWRPTTTNGAPEPRSGFSTVWSGKSMVVWGGASADGSRLLDTGGRYNPRLDLWSPTTTQDAPRGRTGHSAVWTGTEMIIWGGWNDGVLGSGGRYSLDPSIDADGDGFTVCGGDCNDANRKINPRGVDLPGNRLDEDCDGVAACDPSAGWPSHGALMRCVVKECQSLAAAGQVSRGACLSAADR